MRATGTHPQESEMKKKSRWRIQRKNSNVSIWCCSWLIFPTGLCVERGTWRVTAWCPCRVLIFKELPKLLCRLLLYADIVDFEKRKLVTWSLIYSFYLTCSYTQTHPSVCTHAHKYVPHLLDLCTRLYLIFFGVCSGTRLTIVYIVVSFCSAITPSGLLRSVTTM